MGDSKSYIKGKHILAVDDEEDVLETIEDILEGAYVPCLAHEPHLAGIPFRLMPVPI